MMNVYIVAIVGFTFYRLEIAYLYNKRLGELYEIAWKKSFKCEDLSPKEIEEWNSLCNNDLDILLWHSDCDGILTVSECKKIYKILKQYESDLFSLNYRKLHENFLSNLKFCIDNNRIMYFS